MTPDELRAAQDRAVEAAAGRTLEPTAGGVSARATAEHDAAATARNEAVGHEMTARALSDIEVAEREAAGSAPPYRVEPDRPASGG